MDFRHDSTFTPFPSEPIPGQAKPSAWFSIAQISTQAHGFCFGEADVIRQSKWFVHPTQNSHIWIARQDKSPEGRNANTRANSTPAEALTHVRSSK